MRPLIYLIILCLIVGLVTFLVWPKQSVNNTMSKTIHYYVPLGDSYTFGEKVPTEDTWPNLLVKDLNEHGVNTVLLVNPARSGWSTKDLIEKELPVFDATNVSFTTILIGTNDIVQGVGEAKYESNLNVILDRVQAKIPDPSKIILLTLPDFTVTPTGKEFVNSTTASQLAKFNQIIQTTAKKRGLKIVDLFPISQSMRGNYDLMARDWLHPSAKEYVLWEKQMFPVALELLKK